VHFFTRHFFTEQPPPWTSTSRPSPHRVPTCHGRHPQQRPRVSQRTASRLHDTAPRL